MGEEGNRELVEGRYNLKGGGTAVIRDRWRMVGHAVVEGASGNPSKADKQDYQWAREKPSHLNRANRQRTGTMESSKHGKRSWTHREKIKGLQSEVG